MDWEQRYRRFQECQRYVAWSDYDAQRVRSLATIVDPSLQALVDDFYTEIERHAHTSRIVSGGQQQVSRLKEALLCWLRDLFTGSYDRDYLRRRYEVGRQHVRMGLDQTYTILAMARLRSGLLAALRERWQGEPTDLLLAAESLNKLLDLDLAIIDDAYQSERTNSAGEATSRCAGDPEETKRDDLWIAARVHESLLPGTIRHPSIDLAQGVLAYCGAGHPTPLLIRRGSGAIEVLESQNVVIGVVEQCLFDVPQDTRSINPGDRLLFYTDGLIETTDSAGNMLGTAGLTDMARFTCAGTLLDTADCILERTAAFCEGPPHDDMTLIVAEFKQRQDDPIATPENQNCQASKD